MSILALFFGIAASLPSEAREPFPTSDSNVELTHPSGTSVTARIRAPKRSTRRRLPAVMVFGGFQEAAFVLAAVRPTRAVVVASFDYPYGGPRKLGFWELLSEAPKLRRMVREVTPLIESLAVKLKEREDVDPNRIVLVGASFGAPFAIYSAARGASLYLVLVHGFADVVGTFEYRLLRHFAENGVPGEWLRRVLAWALARIAWLFAGLPDVEDEARKLRADQRVLTIEAKLDRMTAPSSRVKLREALEASEAKVEFVAMPSEHLRGIDDRLLAEILPVVEGWMERVGVFPPR